MSVPLQSILNLCTVLQISDSVSMSWSWYVHQLLPAHLQHMGPNHPHCLQHTCSTTHNTHPPTHFSRLTYFCSKNPFPLVLSRYYHYLVHRVVKYVLATHSADCKVLHTCMPVCLPSQMCAATSTLSQQCYNGLQLNKPHNNKPQVYME